jgi:hypothetical protein
MIRTGLQDVLRYAKSRGCTLDCFSRSKYSRETYYIAVREPGERAPTILDSITSVDDYIQVVAWWGQCAVPVSTATAAKSLLLQRVGQPPRAKPRRRRYKHEKPRPSGFGQRADDWYQSQLDPDYYSQVRLEARATISTPITSRTIKAGSSAKRQSYSPDDGGRG